MPWTVDDPPALAKKWSLSQRRRCVAAANSTLKRGGSDEEAIRACIGAAKRKERMDELTKEIESKPTEVSPPDDEKTVTKKKMMEAEEGGVSVVSYIPMGAVSFSDVEEYAKAEAAGERVRELTRQFQTLSGNILYSETITDKGAALTTLVSELDQRLADAIKPKGLVATFSDVLRSGLVRVSGSGKEKVAKASASDRAARSGSRLTVWKEGDRYRWLAIYSNKYRDRDNPPEILAEQAHKEFVKEVEAGLTPYPELWHWHVPGTRWGVADWLAYDDTTGFSLASGWVDAGHDKEAETMAGLDLDLRVSHGMPETSLERDADDPTVIIRYRSMEISDLPGFAAANPLTSFNVIKEGDSMSIPEEKLAYLKLVGMPQSKIDELQADLEGKAKEAEVRGLDFKETEPTTSKSDEAPAPETVPAPEPEKPLTRADVAEAVSSVVAPLTSRLDAIEASQKALSKPVEEQVAEKAADTPAASLTALILRNVSVRSNDKAKTETTVTGPAQTDAKSKTGIPFLDGLLATPKA